MIKEEHIIGTVYMIKQFMYTYICIYIYNLKDAYVCIAYLYNIACDTYPGCETIYAIYHIDGQNRWDMLQQTETIESPSQQM